MWVPVILSVRIGSYNPPTNHQPTGVQQSQFTGLYTLWDPPVMFVGFYIP